MIFSNQTLFLAKKYGLVKAVEMMVEAGYPAIDITMTELGLEVYKDSYREVAEELCEISKRTGVKFIQAHAPFCNGERYERELVPLFPRAFEFCSLVGIKTIVVHPVMFGGIYEDREAHFRKNMDFYRGLAPLAKRWGVRIAIENMWGLHRITRRISDHVCADPKELCLYHDTLNDPEVYTICLDIGHVALCSREPEDAIREIGHDRLGCIHAHDVDYVNDLHIVPGASRINWDKVARALAEVNYCGSFNMEADYFFEGFFEENYPAVARFMADTARTIADRIEAYKRA